jgi:hypothetical protein
MKKFFVLISIIIVSVFTVIVQVYAETSYADTGNIIGCVNIDNADVILYDEYYNTIEKTISDEDGNFIFNSVLVGDKYMVYAEKDGYIRNGEKNINVTSGETVYVNIFIAESDTLATTTEPICTGTISGYTVPTGVSLTLYNGANDIGFIISDENGYYCFENLPEGTEYEIFAVTDGYLLKRESNITVKAGEVTNVNIFLAAEEPSATLTVGTVYGCPGSEVDIPVSIVNNLGATNFKLELYYDNSLLTPISVEEGGIMSANTLKYEITEEFIVISGNIDLTKVSEKDIVNVKFTINPTVHTDNAKISLKNVSLQSEYGQEILYQRIPGSVKITLYPYEISQLILTDYTGNTLNFVPTNGNFISEVEVTKLLERNSRDYFVVAVYGKDGSLLSLNYMKANIPTNESFSCGVNIPKIDGEIGEIKTFVWNSLSDMVPLAESVSLK